jgi:hypothetical protein
LEKFTNILLGIISVVLIIGSIHYVSGDHSFEYDGIFKDETHVNIADSIGSKWLIHVQLVVQNTEGQLINVSESTHGSYIPHKVTDYIFDEYLGKKEIITINKMKYEKVQFIETNDVKTYTGFFNSVNTDMHSLWELEFCLKTNEHGNEQGISCIPIFQTITPHVPLDGDDIFRQTWTILREL